MLAWYASVCTTVTKESKAILESTSAEILSIFEWCPQRLVWHLNSPDHGVDEGVLEETLGVFHVFISNNYHNSIGFSKEQMAAAYGTCVYPCI